MPESFDIQEKKTLHNRELINYVLFPEADSIDNPATTLKTLSYHYMICLFCDIKQHKTKTFDCYKKKINNNKINSHELSDILHKIQ